MRYGLHHFHVGVRDLRNPKGRSGTLVFADVLPGEFRVVAIANHLALQRDTGEHKEFFRTCLSYISKDIPPGSAFMPNPVLTSGRSMIAWAFARKCQDLIEQIDPRLDDPVFITSLYSQQNGAGDAPSVAMPRRSNMVWHFKDIVFGILDKESMVFFKLLPYFQR